MKVVKNLSNTTIYPFALPDLENIEDARFDSCIVVREDGTIKLIWGDAPVMSAKAAQALSEALLHASEIAQNGQK